MSRLRNSAVATLLVFAAGTAGAQPALPGWLAGCWQGEAGTAAANSFEAWTNPGGGRMLGVSRTLRGSGSNFEYMRIDARGAELVYVPQPEGRAADEFKASAIDAQRIVFANPQHDFPKYIEYERNGARLEARLSAQPPGAEGRRIQFTFRRVDCDPIFPSK